MTNIMIEISLYLMSATLLGLFIGWLFTRTRFNEKYEKRKESLYNAYTEELKTIDTFDKELNHYKKTNQKLIEDNCELDLRYQGQKFVLDEHNSTLDKFQKLLKSKDDIIEKLTHQLSLEEDKRIALEKRHAKEIDNFLFERVEMSEKFKAFTEKQNHFATPESPSASEPSWFDKIFLTTSKN